MGKDNDRDARQNKPDPDTGLMRLIEPFMKSSLIEQRRETLEALNDYVKGHPEIIDSRGG